MDLMESVSDLHSLESSQASSSSAPGSLIFDKNSLINATIYLGKTPTYTVITNKAMSRTDICDLPAHCVVATIKRREVFSDTVKFPERKDANAVAINKWLRPITSPNHKEPCTSLVTDLGSFVWLTNANYRLALYPEDDNRIPIAYMSRVRHPEPLVLVLKEGSEGIVEDILVSFIILEQKMRMVEKRRQSEMMYGQVASTGLGS